MQEYNPKVIEKKWQDIRINIIFKISGNYDQLALLIAILLSFVYFPTM